MPLYGFVSRNINSRMSKIESGFDRVKVRAFSQTHGSRMFKTREEAEQLLSGQAQCVREWYKVTECVPF